MGGKALYFPVFAVFFSVAVFAQSDALRKIDTALKSANLVDASQRFLTVDTLHFDKSELAFYNLLRAQYFEATNNDAAYGRYMRAKSLYNEIDSIGRTMEINISLAYLATTTDYKDSGLAKQRYAQAAKYLDEYMAFARKSGSEVKLARAWMEQGSLNIKGDSIYNLLCFRKALRLNRGRDKNLESAINNNIGVLFNEGMQQHDSSLFYLQKNVAYFIEIKDNNALCENYINQAANYYYMGDYRK